MNTKTEAKTAKEYIDLIENEERKAEIQQLHELIIAIVPELKPHIMSGMIGYGKYKYKYASGRTGEWFVIGLASNKNYISLYATLTENNEYIAETYKAALPKANIGKSCIRFKKIEDIDLGVIKKILKKNLEVAEKNDFNFDFS